MNCRESEGAPAEPFLTAPLRWLAAAASFLTCLTPFPAFAAAPGASSLQRPAEPLPPCFEANQGQAEPRFSFIARGQHHAVCLAPDEILIVSANESSEPAPPLRLTLVGANAQAAAAGVDRLRGTVNYFLGNDAAQWHTGVPTFQRVRFDRVLPGIDVVYYSSRRQLEYDFLVAAGANPRSIRLRVDSASAVRLNHDGELILEAGGVRLLQHRPIAYQTIAGVRSEVAARYVLDGRDVTLALGRYDTNQPLVIDPVLSYSTYVGAGGQQNGWSIAVDGSGSAVIAGETLASLKGLPLTGYQTNFGGGTSTSGDAFVAKLNAAGTAFDYITYLGGHSLDGAVSVAVDAAGNAVVGGYTTSRDFPVTTGTVQTTLSGANIPRTSAPNSDGFVTRLDPTGTMLLFSTFLGGKSLDSVAAVAVDATGAVHVAGYTQSTNFPVATTFGSSNCGAAILQFVYVTNDGVVTLVATNLPTACPAQATLAGKNDIFVTALNADATAFVYSTYLGGSGDENALGLALDAAGNAFVTGWTTSTDFPVTTDAFQPVLAGKRDAFAVRFNADGALHYSTYLGGGQDDVGYKIAATGSGEAFVAGAKSSTDFPTTPGAYNHGGVFRSDDGGGLWATTGPGMTHTVVEDLISTPGAILAATPRGVFRTVDRGASWTVSFTSLSVGGVRALASDATGTNLYAGTGEGILLSTNAGATWEFENSGLGARSIFAVSHRFGTLLAGTRGAGIFRSTNNASSWKAANGGLGNLYVNAFAPHPTDASILYVATDGGVFRSTNQGVSWRAAHTGLTTKKTQALVVDAVDPTVLYAGTTRGVFKSVDQGGTWLPMSTGMTSSNVLSLAIDRLSPSLYAGTTNGLFKSTDAGASWSASSTGLAPRAVKTLLVDPVQPAVAYAGVLGTNAYGGSNDVFVTKFLPDGNVAWSLAFGGTKNDQAYGVAVDAMGQAFVAGSTDSTNFPVAHPGPSLLITNAGKSDAFLTRISPDGADFLFSIRLGGKSPDFGYGVALDSMGAAYVTGRTQSTNFPTAAALQPGFAGKSDAFVVKVISEVAVAVARDAEQVVVRWPGPLPGYALEGANSFGGPWNRVSGAPTFKDGWSSVTLPAATASQFFRLRRTE